MATDDILINVYDKKLLSTPDLRDNLVLSMLFREWRNRRDVCGDDGVYDKKATPQADGNNAIKFSGFDATDGAGQRIRSDGSAPRWQAIKIPPEPGTVFTVGLAHYVLHDGVEVNPRTGQPEYKQYKEVDGFLANPDLVTDNGNGTITFRVNTACGGVHQHRDRLVKVWLVDRTAGGSGPQSADVSIAFETRTVTMSGPNNIITTVAQFGQLAVDTNPAAYYCLLIGPKVTVKTEEDQRNSAERLYLADVTGVADGNPISVIDVTDQNLISFNPGSDINAIVEGVTPSAVISGFAVTASGGGLTAKADTGDSFLGGQRFRKTTTTNKVLPDNATSYVYWSGISPFGQLQSVLEGIADVAFLNDNLVLAKVVTAGGNVSTITDLRRWFRGRAADTRVTTGHDASVRVSDFDSLQHAVDWLRSVYNEGLTGRPMPELSLLGMQAVAATVDIDFPITIRGCGNSQNQRLSWSFNGPLFKLKAGCNGTRFLGVRAKFNLAGVQGSSAFVSLDATLVGASAATDVVVDGCYIESQDANLAYVFQLAGSYEDFTIRNCNMRNSGLTGIFSFDAGGGTHWQKRGRFMNNRIYRNDVATASAAIVADSTVELVVSGNKVDGHQYGILVNGTITNNQITGVDLFPILGSGTYDVITNNRVTDSMLSDPGAANGAIGSTGDESMIANNMITGCVWRQGIYTTGRRVQVMDNHYLVDAGSAANKGLGIKCTGDETLIKGNVVKIINAVAASGIEASGQRAMISGNKVVGVAVANANDGTGILLSGGAAVCNGNNVHSVSGVGIKMTQNHNAANGNVITATNTGAAVYITGASVENIVQGNIIETLSGGAVAVKVDNPSTDNCIQNNTYSSSGTIETNSARTRRSVITQSGIATFNATQDTISVAFDVAFPDATWEHTTSIVNNDAGVAITVQLRNKAAGGFDIEPSAQFNGEVAWTATRKFRDNNIPMA